MQNLFAPLEIFLYLLSPPQPHLPLSLIFTYLDSSAHQFQKIIRRIRANQFVKVPQTDTQVPIHGSNVTMV